MALVRMSCRAVSTVCDNAMRVFEKQYVEPPALDIKQDVLDGLLTWLRQPEPALAQKLAASTILSPADRSIFLVSRAVDTVYIGYLPYELPVPHRDYWFFRHMNTKVELDPAWACSQAIKAKEKAYNQAVLDAKTKMYEQRNKLYDLMMSYPSMNKFLKENPSMKDLVPHDILARISDTSGKKRTGLQVSDDQKELLTSLRRQLVSNKMTGE